MGDPDAIVARRARQGKDNERLVAPPAVRRHADLIRGGRARHRGGAFGDYWSLTGLALRSFSTRAKICYGGHGAVISEEAMAKGQIKGNKEAKKPKADKNQSKTHVSAYKASQGKGGQSMAPPAKKS
jgi:hypothetical protein